MEENSSSSDQINLCHRVQELRGASKTIQHWHVIFLGQVRKELSIATELSSDKPRTSVSGLLNPSLCLLHVPGQLCPASTMAFYFQLYQIQML